MTRKSPKQRRSTGRWPDTLILILRALVQVNAILYDWLGGRGGPRL
jgi:hypothetical protein